MTNHDSDHFPTAPAFRPRGRHLTAALAAGVLVAGLLAMLGAWPATARPAGQNGQIAFSRYDPAFDDTVFYTINPDGTHEDQVVPFALECPHWSPDGTRIASCGGLNDAASVIINRDNGHYRVIPMPDPDLFTPCYVWTPDAKRLACEGYGNTNAGRNGIYTVRSSDGKDLRRITSNPGGADIPIEYAPNGKRLVLSRYDANEDSVGLFVVRSDGTHLRQIARAGVTCCGGGWSPQGNKIVFSRHVTPDVHSSMWIVHANGTGLREVPAQPEYGCGGANADPNAGGCFDPSWSPDGSRIVFGNGGQDLGRNVYTVKPDGTGLIQVTHGGATQSNESPDWGTHPLAR